MQLPLNIDFQQVLLHMLNFAILTMALYFILYKPVKKFMDDRAEMYAEKDREAKEKLEEAENLRLEYEERLKKADAEIEEIKAQKQKETEAEISLMREKAGKAADEIIEKGRRDAKDEHDRIIRDAEDEISEMVASAAGKLAFKDTSEAYDSFLDSVEDTGNG